MGHCRAVTEKLFELSTVIRTHRRFGESRPWFIKPIITSKFAEIGCASSSTNSMGAGASIASPPNKAPMRDPNTEASARTSRSANSVRAMALKNHARQENSYIPSNRLRPNFSKSAIQAGGPDERSNHRGAVTVQENMVTHSEVDLAAPQAVANQSAAVAVNGLMQFKSAMNLNLKISLEDDNDWGKVSMLQSRLLSSP